MQIRTILRPYVPVAKLLVQTMGSDCEVVLHDLQDPEHSVVWVENPTVTERQVGESFTWLIRQVILSAKLEDDVVSNYYFRAPNGKLIRSSTLLIRDEAGQLAGALCVNLDTSRVTEQIQYLQSFLPQAEGALQPIAPDERQQDVRQMIARLVDGIFAGTDPHGLSREQRLEKVGFMEEKGVFLVKGSVELVAQRMGLSPVTVYSYLDAVRGKRG